MSTTSASSRKLLVTQMAGDSSSSFVWDASAPLPVGRFRWILEKTHDGIRVRDLRGGAKPSEITDAELARGKVIALGGALKLRIRSEDKLEPVFISAKGQAATAELAVYECLGNWVKESTRLTEGFSATSLSGSKLFTLSRSGQGYELDVHSAELAGLGAGAGATGAGKRTLSASELSALVLESGARVWRFGPWVAAAEIAAPSEKEIDLEAIWFKKALRAAGIGLATLIVLSVLWPASKPSEELVPAQFAKIVLNAATKTETAGAQTATHATTVPNEAKNAPEKVQKAAVVQAFRAKQLQSAMSGLLKGGMTKLLAQSDFVAGSKGTSEARRIFDGKSSALGATGADIGAMAAAKEVKVAAVGGEGGAGKTGYGKGEKAAIKGQGQSFVSMDIGNAAVQDGLSKDEVGEVIHRHLSEVRYCYESAMVRKGDIEGKLVVNFTIGGGGAVKSTEVKQSTLEDPRLDDCIIRRLVTWKFPNPKGGIDVAVSYPFIFKTLGR